MTRAIAQTYDIAQTYRKQVTMAFFAVSVVMALVYAMNIYKVISSTVALKATESQIAAVGATVDKLDGQYLEFTGSITPDKLAQFGMAQGRVGEYIDRSGALGRAVIGVAHEL